MRAGGRPAGQRLARVDGRRRREPDGVRAREPADRPREVAPRRGDGSGSRPCPSTSTTTADPSSSFATPRGAAARPRAPGPDPRAGRRRPARGTPPGPVEERFRHVGRTGSCGSGASAPTRPDGRRQQLSDAREDLLPPGSSSSRPAARDASARRSAHTLNGVPTARARPPYGTAALLSPSRGRRRGCARRRHRGEVVDGQEQAPADPLSHTACSTRPASGRGAARLLRQRRRAGDVVGSRSARGSRHGRRRGPAAGPAGPSRPADRVTDSRSIRG
jgi:hypothetical protein